MLTTLHPERLMGKARKLAEDKIYRIARQDSEAGRPPRRIVANVYVDSLGSKCSHGYGLDDRGEHPKAAWAMGSAESLEAAPWVRTWAVMLPSSGCDDTQE
jgi:hypothetical protein